MSQAFSPILIGRDAELRDLRSALERAAAGAGGAFFLVGEAGVGKSRLVLETADLARRGGLLALCGRAVPQRLNAAFRPVREALLGFARTSEFPQSPHLAAFRPALAQLVPDWAAPDDGPVDTSLVALAEGVLRLLQSAGRERGCVLLLEDLHWADPDTLSLVEYLADNLAGERILLVGSLRPESGEALTLARALRLRRAASILDLSRLPTADVRRIAAACLGTDSLPGELLTYLQDRADGLPLLVEDLLASLLRSGALVECGTSWQFRMTAGPALPDSFATSVRTRLAALDPEHRRVIEAAAILGRRFDWHLLGPIAEIPDRTIVSALRAAVLAQLVVDGGEGIAGFQFRHALTRDAILADLLEPERAVLCQSAVTAIGTAFPGLPGNWCTLSAELAERAGNVEVAAAHLVESARRALRGGALATAIASLDRARSLGPTDDQLRLSIEEALVEALALAGRADRVFEVGEVLLADLARAGALADRVATTHIRLARAAVSATDWKLAEAHVRDAERLTEQQRPADLAARVALMQGYIALGQFHCDEALGAGERALALAHVRDQPALACEALEIVGRAHRPRDLRSAEGAFARSLAIAEGANLPLWRVRALNELATVDVLSLERTDRIAAALELAETAGAVVVTAVARLHAAIVQFFIPDLERGLRLAREMIRDAERYRLGMLVPAGLVVEAGILALQLRFDEMDHSIGRIHAEYPTAREQIAIALGFGQGIRAILLEDGEAALVWLDRAIATAGPLIEETAMPFAGLWALLHTCAQVDDAAARDLARMHQAVLTVNAGLLALADTVALGREGLRDEASTAYESGARMLARAPWFLNVGRRYVAAEALAGGWGEPVAWLREAEPFFDGLGHQQLAAACRALLRQAGAPAARRRTGETTPVHLRGLGITAREADVLALIAEGRSNREIADRLVISPRTVEKHVEMLLAKSGTSTRAQLVAVALRRADDVSG